MLAIATLTLNACGGSGASSAPAPNNPTDAVLPTNDHTNIQARASDQNPDEQMLNSLLADESNQNAPGNVTTFTAPDGKFTPKYLLRLLDTANNAAPNDLGPGSFCYLLGEKLLPSYFFLFEYDFASARGEIRFTGPFPMLGVFDSGQATVPYTLTRTANTTAVAEFPDSSVQDECTQIKFTGTTPAIPVDKQTERIRFESTIFGSVSCTSNLLDHSILTDPEGAAKQALLKRLYGRLLIRINDDSQAFQNQNNSQFISFTRSNFLLSTPTFPFLKTSNDYYYDFNCIVLGKPSNNNLLCSGLKDSGNEDYFTFNLSAAGVSPVTGKYYDCNKDEENCVRKTLADDNAGTVTITFLTD